MSRRRGYFRSACIFCGKEIAGNRMGWHQREHCKPAQEHFERERLERLRRKPVERLTREDAEEVGRESERLAWLKVKPITEMNVGEIFESGRMDEVINYRRDRQQ